MFFGTDLAMERREIAGDIEGLTHSEQTVGDATVSTIEVTTPEAAKGLLHKNNAARKKAALAVKLSKSNA